jgi:hypothetical protein
VDNVLTQRLQYLAPVAIIKHWKQNNFILLSKSQELILCLLSISAKSHRKAEQISSHKGTA